MVKVVITVAEWWYLLHQESFLFFYFFWDTYWCDAGFLTGGAIIVLPVGKTTCTGHYSQGAGNESSPPRPKTWLLQLDVCVRNPEGALCRHSNAQHGLAGFWLWGEDTLESTTTWGPGPLKDCEFALSHFPDIYECERQTDRTCAWPVFSPLILYSHCYDMTHRILCVPPCFRPITQSSVVMRMAPEICGEVFKRLMWSG